MLNSLKTYQEDCLLFHFKKPCFKLFCKKTKGTFPFILWHSLQVREKYTLGNQKRLHRGYGQPENLLVKNT